MGDGAIQATALIILWLVTYDMSWVYTNIQTHSCMHLALGRSSDFPNE